MRPSPARAEAHDATTWLPLPDVDELPRIDEVIAGASATTEAPSAPPADDAPAPPSPARARPHDARSWFPLPVPDELPSIDELLTQAPWEAKPSPARAEPHDATAWLPLPDLTKLAPIAPPAPATVPNATPNAAPNTPITAPASPVAVPEPARSAPAPWPLRLRTLARPRAAIVALLTVGTLVLALVGLTRLADSGSSVEVRADGRRVSLDTDAATVGALLRERNLRLGEYDRVVPPARTELRDGLTVTVLRAFPITLDVDGDVRTVYTTYASPSDFVRRDLGVRDGLTIRSAPNRLQADSTLMLRTPHNGRLVVDAAEVDYDIPALDVDELLAQYSVALGAEDYVIDRSGRAVGLDALLVDGEQYSVIRVGREVVRVDEAYSLPDERRPDHTLAVGEKRVDNGADGVMSVSYEVVLRNGEEVERNTLSRVPLKLARPTVTYYGTRADPMWDRIAQCETGGNWGMQGPLYSGGLGFYNGTWDSFGGRDFATNAGLATREEQIIVAERIRSSVGIGGWGCARVLGYVR